MDFGAQFLHALLVRDAEMLLFIDDHETEILELHGLGEQRMRADHDIDRAVGKTRTRLRDICGRDQPARLPDPHRKAAEAIREGLEVLPREQRRRHHNRDLRAVTRGEKCGAQRDFGFAEADVAADQPIHRPPLAQIVDYGIDRGALVVRLVIGKARAEFVIETFGHGEFRCVVKTARGRDLDERRRHFADALLEACFAVLPTRAAKPVQFRAGIFGAVAGKQFEIFDRKKQAIVIGVVDFETVVRRAERFDGFEADETADAMIDVHDEIACMQARKLGDEILCALLAPLRPSQPVA